MEIMQFIHVSFGYDESKTILNDVCFRLEEGKTYALVGPTGGGKSTTASLMARLFDPISGTVEFKDRDIRTFEPSELAQKIGFILQEPFLFTGTVGENIRYGNLHVKDSTDEELLQTLHELDLHRLVDSFEQGLATEVHDNSENISLGQKQLIAFIRILLRQPDLLILDEATANIDTVTERLLSDILAKLPTKTTKVVIAHRLNTIKDADEIFFINDGKVQPALDFDDALELIDNSKRGS